MPRTTKFRDGHPVAFGVFVALAVLLVLFAVLGFLAIQSLDDWEVFPDCLGNC